MLQNKFLQLVVNKGLKGNDDAKKFMIKDFVIVPHTLDLAQLERLLERNSVVFIEKRANGNLEHVYAASPKDMIRLIK